MLFEASQGGFVDRAMLFELRAGPGAQVERAGAQCQAPRSSEQVRRGASSEQARRARRPAERERSFARRRE